MPTTRWKLLCKLFWSYSPSILFVFLYQFDSIQDFWVKRYKEEIVVIPSVSLILLNVCAWTKTGQQDISFSMSINIMIGLLMFSMVVGKTIICYISWSPHSLNILLLKTFFYFCSGKIVFAFPILKIYGS